MSKTFYEIHFTGEGFRSLHVYRRFFADALATVRKRHADYLAEVAAWYETGDGRSVADGGRGYCYPYCIHGASLWVDHDIPCGACEMGDDSVIGEAITLGRERFLRFLDRWEWLCAAPGDLATDVRHHLEGWTLSLFPGMENTK